MLSRLSSRSADLRQLIADGFDLEVRSGYLLIHRVPYATVGRGVAEGILATDLDLAGDRTRAPSSHVAYWIGEFPCDASGRRMDELGNPGQQRAIDGGLSAGHTFSRRPASGGYANYHEKVTTYVGWITGQAEQLDASVTAHPRGASRQSSEDSVFEYMETASARAGIGPINSKIAGGKIAIVGLGGTGSYVLDLIAKAPVGEIHLFDGDYFLTHNAFRAPGAPSLAELEACRKKVDWYHSIYSKMRRGIVPHEHDIEPTNVSELGSMSFVFLCIEGGPQKKAIVDFLIQAKISFVDVGAGIVASGECLSGTIRVTKVTGERFQHAATRIPVSGAGPAEYDQNIQIVELNALNATLAVIRWKKDLGFYHDFRGEYSTVYAVSTNAIVNDEVEDEGPDPAS